MSGCIQRSDNKVGINSGKDIREISDQVKSDPDYLINPDGTEIINRFRTPEGYKRIESDSGSPGYYLQHYRLKNHGTDVYYFDGTKKPRQDLHIAVLDIDAGTKDLQQCADAIMRLRAEYFYSKEEYDKIHFNFTNGFPAEYRKWADGYRIKVSGNNTNWYFSGKKDYSYGTFKNYLEMVFSYAGTLSLDKELVSIPEEELRIGDVFIYGGSPGHAVLIVDVAVNEKNKSKIFLLAQSYMPAQDIHILKNPENETLSPWYDLKDHEKLYTPEWTFEKNELKRFED